LFNTFFFHGKK